MAERDFAPGIRVRLYQKDLRIVEELAGAAQAPLPAGAATTRQIGRLIEQGRQDEDLAALIKAVEEDGAS
jgi:3-hydroxyisobutyrate dehydrogenase-like beta-hydroxyacid dehydrogenase